FGRRLEERADVDVEAEIGEGGGNDLGAAVVAVLAHLGDEHARTAAFVAGEGFDLFADAGEAFIAFVGRGVNAADRMHFGLVAAENFFHRVGNFADGGAGARRFDGKRQEIGVAAGAFGQG